jgi:hypothetical protein
MAGVIEPITEGYDVCPNVIRGNCSETFVYRVAEIWQQNTENENNTSTNNRFRGRMASVFELFSPKSSGIRRRFTMARPFALTDAP